MRDVLTLFRAVQTSEWAKEFVLEQEQTRSFIIDIAGAGEDEADAIMEQVKRAAIHKSLETTLSIMAAYRMTAAGVCGLLQKGIPLSYIKNNISRIRW